MLTGKRASNKCILASKTPCETIKKEKNADTDC